MSSTLEQIETKIAYLERANAELSDVVYQQQREIEALKLRLTELAGRFSAAQEQPPVFTPEDEKPPHY